VTIIMPSISECDQCQKIVVAATVTCFERMIAVQMANRVDRQHELEGSAGGEGFVGKISMVPPGMRSSHQNGAPEGCDSLDVDLRVTCHKRYRSSEYRPAVGFEASKDLNGSALVGPDDDEVSDPSDTTDIGGERDLSLDGDGTEVLNPRVRRAHDQGQEECESDGKCGNLAEESHVHGT